MNKTKVIIAGGGFAGLYGAMHLDKWLAGRADVEVTLISRENFILFTPMLHEVAAGDLCPGDIVNPLRRILRYVKVVAVEVRVIDLSALAARMASVVETFQRLRKWSLEPAPVTEPPVPADPRSSQGHRLRNHDSGRD
jgi:NADH dehydrogenase FAD-containing subunit